ncbi:phage major capsid protein [Agromyces bauzanensis]
MAVSTTTAPELTADQVSTVLVKPLEQASVFLAAGPRIIDTAGPLRLPKLGPATSPAWFAENAQITPEIDPVFDEITLLPSTMQSVKTLTRFSNELARQSVIALDAALKERLVKDVADTLDRQFLGLTGDGITKPKGLFAYAGQSIAAIGALNLDKLLDAEALALGANVNPDALKWVMTSREFIALRKIKTATTGSNQYVLQPDPTQAGRYTVFGHPVIVTNHLTDTTGTPNTGNMALVDFSQIVVARDLAPSVKILDQTFGDYDQQAIRVVARYDVAPLNDAAVIKLTGITI